MKIHANATGEGLSVEVTGMDWLCVFTLRCSEAKEEEGGFHSMRKSSARNTRDKMI